jgi:D-glycero-D-manno-heptose 1,7-bisphosphate phosphatase
VTENQKSKPAVFIDRDGTIIRDADYLANVSELDVFDFSGKALELLRDKGYLIIVLSNQSGVGRGLFSTETVHEINNALNERLGGLVDAFYFCPHAPDEACECRKPATGLVQQALEDIKIDIPNSWMVGDKVSDIELGFNAGIATALVLTGYGESDLPKLSRMPDLVASDLLNIARDICLRCEVGD